MLATINLNSDTSDTDSDTDRDRHRALDTHYTDTHNIYLNRHRHT